MDESVIFVGEVPSNKQPIEIVDLTKILDDSESEEGSCNDRQQCTRNILKENNQNHEINELTIDCPVCLESLFGLEVRVTQCGHLFCKKCLDALKPNSKKKVQCPKCRKIINKLTPVYF